MKNILIKYSISYVCSFASLCAIINNYLVSDVGSQIVQVASLLNGSKSCTFLQHVNKVSISTLLLFILQPSVINWVKSAMVAVKSSTNLLITKNTSLTTSFNRSHLSLWCVFIMNQLSILKTSWLFGDIFLNGSVS